MHLSPSQNPKWSSLHSRSSTRAAAAAGKPLVTFKRATDAQPTAVVSERRAADVAVLGGSTAAVLAAYTLAKTGRKVLLLPDFGLSAVVPPPRRLQPLKLPDPDPLLVHLAAESAAYWRGLEVITGAQQLLAPQQSADVVLDPERDHQGALGWSKLQEACAAAGVATSVLAASEAMSAFRQLQLPPHRASCLLQPDGGVIRAHTAAAAAQQLAKNVGVMVREGLCLQGWQDRGSCFELRAVSRLTPDVACLYEAEVLLLVPGAWTGPCLNLFGLQLEGVQAREVIHCTVPASNPELLQQLPLLQSWGAACPADAPQQPEGFSVLPSGIAGDSRVALQQLPAWGLAVDQPLDWQPTRFRSMQQEQQEREEGQLGGEQEGKQSQTSSDWADLQVAQLHASCSQLLRGLAPLNAPGTNVSSRSSIVSCAPDGRPLLGYHPGFDPGRVLVCCGLSGSQPYGPGCTSSTYQLSPILAKLAADVVKSGGVGSESGSEAVLKMVGLQREGMQTVSVLEGFDGWEGLMRLQEPQGPSAQEREKQQDLERDTMQDLMGSRQ